MTKRVWFKGALTALSVLMMAGCASKLVDAEDEKVLDYSMTNSRKIEIVNSATSKTFITVTYLNPLMHEDVDQNSEKFIVGTYMATGDGTFEKPKLFGFKVNDDQEDVNVTQLEKESPLLKLIPSANAWADYVLVEAPKTDKINMAISFESDHSARVSATFRKDF